MSSEEGQTTRPTIETILKRMEAMEERLNKRIDALHAELSADLNREMTSARGYLDVRFEALDTRLDRIESEVKLARSETLALRADFREFRAQFKQPA